MEKVVQGIPLTAFEREAAFAFKARLMSVLGRRFSRLVLFGSRARGEGHEASDLDLAVVVHGDAAEVCRAAYDAAANLNLECGYAIRLAPLVLSEESLAGLHRRELGIARAILEEGIPL